MSGPDARLATALADRYTIERELGAGGMATVYLARDLKHDRDVAIKVLRPELAAVIGAERFLSEIKTTANLQHPHILPLHDSGTVNGTVFYVMPFVEGESLRDRLDRETQLPIGDAVRIATEVASALDYAHRHGVIHRDIKPANILLHDGRALVADFGIALAASRSDGGTRMTETGMSLGTPHYMSPEQAMGERNLDARTDIYALGCVLYEMLTGDPPFDASSAQAIVAKVMTEKPAPPSRTRDTVPESVEDAVLTALAKLPADRFASAAEFAAALEGRETGTRRTSDSRRARRTDRRALYALAALAAILAAVAAVGWIRAAGHTTGGDGPLAYQIHLTPSESDVGFVANQLAVSADGKVIVYSDTVGGTRQLWIKERGVADPRPIPGTEGASGPSLSPDGRAVAYTAGDQLRRIPINGGASKLLSDSAVVRTLSASGAWLDNGTVVFLGGSAAIVYAVPDTGGATRRLATADQLYGWPTSIAAVPGGDAVVVSSCDIGGCTTPVITLIRLDPLTRKRILPGTSGAWPVRGGRILTLLADGTLFVSSFDPTSGAIGEGTSVVGGIAVTRRGPEVAIGLDGVMVAGKGGGETFTSSTHLVLAGLDGTTRIIDSSWSGPFANTSRLELSPDGHRLLFSQVEADGVHYGLYTKPYPDGPATLFNLMGTQSARAVWSPDGRRIAWVSDDTGSRVAVWQQAADGSGHPTLLVDDPRGVYEINFSPDGQWLLYRTDDVAIGNGDIYARRTSGDTTTIPIATSPAEETGAAVSPDGRWVAYAGKIGARKEIIVRPFPDVAGARVQVSNGGGQEPLWSRDSRTLYYRQASEGQIIAATMEPDGTFPASGRSVVWQGTPDEYWENDDSRQYALTPDGQGFLLMRRIRSPAGAAAMHLVLREHFVPTESR